MVPNWVFDSVMKTTSNAEFKIFCTIHRLTEGFNKKRDLITYDQFQARTGMARQTVADAVTGLQTKELISKTKRGYSINYAQIVQKLDSPASENKTVQNLDSTVQNLDSRSLDSRLIIRGKRVQKLDSQNTKDSFKKTPTSKDTVEEPVLPPEWLQAAQELVVLGVDRLEALKHADLAKSRGHIPKYISDITGYVVSPEANAKSPAGLAITLIKRNESRYADSPPDAPQGPQKAGKAINGPIDWTAPKYQHGGSSHFLLESTCPICQKQRKSENYPE